MRFALRLVLCLILSTGVVSARDLVPTPPGGGEGVTTCPEHLALPGDGPPRAADKPVRAPDKSAPGDKAGGMPRLIDTRSVLFHCSVDVASDGTIYAAGADQTTADGWSIRIHRSQDDGHTWELWGEITDPSSGNNFKNPCLKVAEGAVDKCYVVYERGYAGTTDQSIRMNSAFLDAPTGDFSATESVISQTGMQFYNPRLFIDDDAFSDFYMYVVAEGDDGATGEDIWFARSTDQGETFETEYEIATTTADNRGYLRPDVCYGYGRYVHVTWYYASHVGAFNDCICYRRAPNDAGGGAGSWESIRTLTSPANGMEEYSPRIAASLSDDRLVISHSRAEDMGSYELLRDLGVLHSDDQGDTFGSDIMYQSLSYVSEAAHDPIGSRWVFAGMEGNHSPGLQTAPHADPANWSDVGVFTTEEDLVYEVAMAVDPDRNGRAAAVWTPYISPGGMDRLMFDAEWRADPGYPVPLEGFPVALEDVPSGAPAVTDLDGDGDLEIVFAVGDGYLDSYLHAVDHDGSEPPGWPVELGFRPAEGAPVAVGPVGPDGETYVIVGRHDGGVVAYDASGTQQWTYTVMSDPTYVSIGALGTPNPYSVVAVSGNSLTFLGPDGQPTPGVISWYFSGSADALAPAAIGDVDGDEIAEAVLALGTSVYAQEMNAPGWTYMCSLPHAASAGVTLWDFDGDGDQEAVVPTVDGFVYLIVNDGQIHHAWTLDTYITHPVSEVAVADIADYSGLELSYTAGDGTLYLHRYTGTSFPFFPVYTGFDLSSGPAVGMVGGEGDLIVGTVDANMAVVGNDTSVRTGWPQPVDDPIRHTPAMGDLDQDGSMEIVWLTDSSCYAVDIGRSPVSDAKTWPMSRHDPKRTGCADCPENVATTVEDGAPGLAHVSFRAPHPNPVSSSTVFAFALPVRAVAELEIIDARGRRIRLVGREELPPGDHLMSWDGADARGRPAPAGTYLARLHVRGPDLNDTQTRKLVLVQ